MSGSAVPRFAGVVGSLLSRRPKSAALLPMLPRDIGLFLRSARTDAKIARLRDRDGHHAAFEAMYRESDDPWSSAAPQYRYQRLKYDRLIALLPQRRFISALDLGCGLGLLAQKLAEHAETVLGVDIAPAAIDKARLRGANYTNLTFQAGDILDLAPSLNGRFDLVVVADVLYYLSPLDDDILHAVVRRVADLLTPGGTCLLANHFFFAADAESRVSRRIHRAFAACPRFSVTSEHRRAFFLATVFRERQPAAQV